MSVTRGQVLFQALNKYLPGQTYDLTAKGKQWVRKTEFAGTYVCYARGKVLKVVRYSEPNAMLGQTVTQVAYEWALVDVADWVKDPTVRKAYSLKDAELRGETQEANMPLVLMNDGWRSPRSGF